MVGQSQGHVVFAQRVEQGMVKPTFVANFDGKLVGLPSESRELFEKRPEARQKLRAVAEHARREVAELEEQRPEFFTQQLHGSEEFSKFGVATFQNFLVGDDLRNFCREPEVCRSFVIPGADTLGLGGAIEGAVDFDRWETRGVVTEIVRRLEMGGIEGALPARGGEGGSAGEDMRVVRFAPGRPGRGGRSERGGIEQGEVGWRVVALVFQAEASQAHCSLTWPTISQPAGIESKRKDDGKTIRIAPAIDRADIAA